MAPSFIPQEIQSPTYILSHVFPFCVKVEVYLMWWLKFIVLFCINVLIKKSFGYQLSMLFLTLLIYCFNVDWQRIFHIFHIMVLFIILIYSSSHFSQTNFTIIVKNSKAALSIPFFKYYQFDIQFHHSKMLPYYVTLHKALKHKHQSASSLSCCNINGLSSFKSHVSNFLSGMLSKWPLILATFSSGLLRYSLRKLNLFLLLFPFKNKFPLFFLNPHQNCPQCIIHVHLGIF